LVAANDALLWRAQGKQAASSPSQPAGSPG